jgi:hypothetical protein
VASPVNHQRAASVGLTSDRVSTFRRGLHASYMAPHNSALACLHRQRSCPASDLHGAPSRSGRGCAAVWGTLRARLLSLQPDLRLSGGAVVSGNEQASLSGHGKSRGSVQPPVTDEARHLCPLRACSLGRPSLIWHRLCGRRLLASRACFEPDGCAAVAHGPFWLEPAGLLLSRPPVGPG